MDDSMNSVHSISAMDISPASSPRSSINPIPSNHLLLNAFQQQQELLSNILFNSPQMNDYQTTINKKHSSDEYDSNSKSVCLFSTVLTDNNNDIKLPNTLDESNQLRQRIIIEPISSVVVEPTSSIEIIQSNSSQRLFNKIFLFIPILLFIIYFIIQYSNTSIIQSRSSNWQNASEYLTKNLIGQDHALEEFKDTMEKHKNFSIVLIEGSIGTGKSYLAASLEKFIPTALISTNTLLGLSPYHWTESDRLTSYLLSYLSSSIFQYLIIDDLDLLSTKETYCQILTTALHSIENNNKNVFILLLQTNTISNICKEYFDNILTKSIKFNMLKRDHIRICIQNEAYIQNVQPKFDNQQIENILNSLKYIDEQGILYSTTGCKQVPSLVMLASKKFRTDN